MIRHYLKTTFRYLWENKMASTINLVGLATALCVVYFALLYVRFELSYDKFNKNVDQVYRVGMNINTPAGINHETTPAPMAEALQTFPEIKTSTRIFLDYYIVQKDQENFGEETLAYADPSVFNVFSFPLIRGNASTAFNAPFDMVLSESAAKKYFGSTDCLDKTLTLDGKMTARVTGVMKDIPVNSHFKTNILLSMSTLFSFDSGWQKNWNWLGFSTYVLLNKNSDVSRLNNKLSVFAKTHPYKEDISYSLELEPLSQLYLHGKVRANKAGSTTTGNYKSIFILSVVALLVLFIACFNFINLTTAFSLRRAKEVGVRKVLGASKKQLVFQFLTDSVAVSLIAFIASIVLCILLLPRFNELTGKTISTGIFNNVPYLSLFLLISIVTGLVSGIYPAFFLSANRVVANLKRNLSHGSRGVSLRHGLVVAQFTISIALIIATLVVYRQLDFIQNEQLGFKKQHNLVIDFHYDDRIRKHTEAVESELTDIKGIQFASVSSCVPGRPNKKFPTTLEANNNEKIELQCDGYFVDYNFLKQYGIELVAGREFSKDFPTDNESMIVNETTVRKLGYVNAKDAIGKKFSQRGKTGKIVGVVKDFHFHSLHEEIAPLTIMMSPGFLTFLTLSVNSDDLQRTIKEVQTRWRDMAPDLPMIYYFSDELFNAQYLAEQRFEKLFVCFAILAILISCLGLLGLTSFNTIQRTKEIGVRKVLGASVSSIVMLLTKQFLKLVLIACLIAFPLGGWIMGKWLNDFAYRTSISWWMFAIGGAIALLTAIITIGSLSIRAARNNPLKSLRTE
jgi:putative ABC transport system permease protein